MKINDKANHLYFWLLLLYIVTACQDPIQTTEKTTNTQPNLFLFLADDLSYNDLGSTGNPYVSTPVIDAFAKKAISFEKMYTPTAMCAPSRSALMTGLYPHRNGCHYNHGEIFSSVKSLPSYLSDLGYQVALVGKRHIKPQQNFPYEYVNYEEVGDYLSKVTKPLCMIYASNDPHGPHLKSEQSLEEVLLPAKWIGTKSTREKLTGYYADIAALDKEFELFLQTIKANKLEEPSVTIFTSDHGYDYFAKWSCYEAGLHVPFFMQTRGISFTTKSVNALTSFVDIVPTFIELAGGTSDNNLDGKSWLGLLNETEEVIHPFIYGGHTTRGIYSGKAYPIRSITNGQWKYIRNLNHEEQFQNILTNGWNFDPPPTEGSWAEWLAVLKENKAAAKWTTFYQKRPYEELYFLDGDPDEIVNLAGEPAHQIIKAQLSQQLDHWMKEQNDKGIEAELMIPLKARDMSKIPKG